MGIFKSNSTYCIAYPLLTCVSLLGTIAILSGHDTAEKFKEQSMKTLNEQIQERLKNYLEEPHYINKINTNAIQQNQLKISQINTLEKHFWLQAQIFKDVNGIQFGTHKDGLLRSIVKEENMLTFNVVDLVLKGENIIYEANSEGGRGAKINSKANYDPRNRPWYKAAVKAGTGTWTKIFAKRTSAETQLRLSAVHPVYEEGNKKLLGVLAVDFFLTQISDFLNAISENNSRAIFIVDRSGKMIASSAKMPLFVDTGDSINRIEAAQSKNKLVRDTAKEIRKQLQGFNYINEIKSIKFSTSFSNEKQVS